MCSVLQTLTLLFLARSTTLDCSTSWHGLKTTALALAVSAFDSKEPAEEVAFAAFAAPSWPGITRAIYYLQYRCLLVDLDVSVLGFLGFLGIFDSKICVRGGLLCASASSSLASSPSASVCLAFLPLPLPRPFPPLPRFWFWVFCFFWFAASRSFCASLRCWLMPFRVSSCICEAQDQSNTALRYRTHES